MDGAADTRSLHTVALDLLIILSQAQQLARKESRIAALLQGGRPLISEAKAVLAAAPLPTNDNTAMQADFPGTDDLDALVQWIRDQGINWPDFIAAIHRNGRMGGRQTKTGTE